MGGYGSGRWNGYPKKYTVEQSRTIDIAHLHKTGWLERDTLKQHVIGSGNLSWFNTRTNEKTANIDIRIDTSGDNPHMRLLYITKRDGQVIANTDEMVRISYTPLHYGSKRVWFHCPTCGTRTRTLHQPPDSIRFLCRACHDLTYASAQTAHKDDRGKYAALSMLLVMEGKVEDTLAELRRTRGNSKARRRLSAKLDAIYQDFETTITQAQTTRQVALTDFDELWKESG